MPTISIFYGISILMFYADPAPPHFHARYGSKEATIDIRELKVLSGTPPRRALALTLEWAKLHQGELLADWELCASKRAPQSIAPLE
jgi:hypothetical protein